ncbi:MAG: hypothetical protein JNK64_28225 [Myxococcales bacterium]|nr:hypothetical protein [Myxococcales bacterium]
MRRVAIAQLGLAVALAIPGTASAGEGERAVSVAAGYATYATPDDEMMATLSPTAGAAVSAGYERALGDEVSWRADLLIAGYLGGGTAGSALGTVGLVYRIDVLKYVPYVDVGVGALTRGGGPFELGVEPALRIGGGVDILQSRARSWGVVATLTSFASTTTTFSAGLRSTWRWGYF